MSSDKFLFSPLVLLGLLASFSATADEPTQPETPKIEKISRGLLMSHNGKMIFSPCRERTYVELEDQSANGVLTQRLLALGLAQGKPLYVEFFGSPETTKLNATWLNFAHTTARCQPAANLEEQWRAVGPPLPESPGWMLRVGENSASLLREGEADYVHSAYALSAPAIGSVNLNLANTPDTHWEFRHALCQAKDNSMLFGWSAKLMNGQQPQLQGCGWQGF